MNVIRFWFNEKSFSAETRYGFVAISIAFLFALESFVFLAILKILGFCFRIQPFELAHAFQSKMEEQTRHA